MEFLRAFDMSSGSIMRASNDVYLGPKVDLHIRPAHIEELNVSRSDVFACDGSQRGQSADACMSSHQPATSTTAKDMGTPSWNHDKHFEDHADAFTHSTQTC
jgi:hypothetical protein